MASEIEVLDLGGLGLPAHPAEHVEVEVGLFGSHPSDIEGYCRSVQVGGHLKVVVDDRRCECEDFEVFLGSPSTGPSEALVEVALERLHGPRGEEDREPPVGDLGREGDVLRSLGTHDDRDLGAQGVDDGLQGLTEAGATWVGERVVLSIVGDRLLAGPDLPDDVDVLACARQGPREGGSIPTLDHLRSRDA